MKYFALLATLCLFAIAAQANEDFLPVPGFGYYPTACVHVVPSNSIVEKLENHRTRVTTPNGKVTEYGKCEVSVPAELAVDNGWNVYASWATPSAKSEVSTYNGNWTIPPNPSDEGKQTIFLFTGLQNMYVGNTEIIQPVLQWGPSAAGGGSYWAVASWYVPSSESHMLVSTLEQVSAGDEIYGTMVLNSDSTWTISSIVESAQVNTAITVKSNPIQDWAAVTLEAYSIGPCTEYPGANVAFTGLYIEVEGAVATPSWESNVQYKNCDEAVSIQGPTAVTLEWKN